MSDSNTGGENPIPLPPPPPPPLPGTNGALNLPTYKETKKKNDEAKKKNETAKAMEDSQFANLPDKLMNTMKREKKPFTYTPLSVGDNGKLDLSQIKSPKMKKRLMANMKDEEEQDENKIESIDSSLQNNKNQDKLDQELNLPTQLNQSNLKNQSSNVLDSFNPVQTKPSLVVPLSVFKDNNDIDYNNTLAYNQPAASLPNCSSNYDFNRSLSPDEKLDQILKEQLNRNLISDSNNNSYSYTPSHYDQNNSSKIQSYGNVKPKKINIAQEIADDRNFNCLPSFSQFSQAPWPSSNPVTKNSTTHPVKVEIQKDQSQYYSNPQLPNYNSPINYDRSQSQQSSYQIPIINLNSQNESNKIPPPPKRQQSLNQNYQEKEIPIQYEEPIQSRSFKILQKLTAEIEDEIENLKLYDQQNKSTYKQQKDPLEDKLPPYYGSLNHIEQPRIRSERRIPIQMDDNFNSTFVQPEYHSKNEQNWVYQNSNLRSTPFANSTSSSIPSFWSSPEWVPKQSNQITPPTRDFIYQGSNIPSRTFRILQMLAGENEGL